MEAHQRARSKRVASTGGPVTPAISDRRKAQHITASGDVEYFFADYIPVLLYLRQNRTIIIYPKKVQQHEPSTERGDVVERRVDANMPLMPQPPGLGESRDFERGER